MTKDCIKAALVCHSNYLKNSLNGSHIEFVESICNYKTNKLLMLKIREGQPTAALKHKAGSIYN